VDEAVCIGCRYCAHVAGNTFMVEPAWGRSRALRQDGDSTDRIQEAIDTCPVDCIHWVNYEQLPQLEEQLRSAGDPAPGTAHPGPSPSHPAQGRTRPPLTIPTRRFGRTELPMPMFPWVG
jgi:ferredoxin